MSEPDRGDDKGPDLTEVENRIYLYLCAGGASSGLTLTDFVEMPTEWKACAARAGLRFYRGLAREFAVVLLEESRKAQQAAQPTPDAPAAGAEILGDERSKRIIDVLAREQARCARANMARREAAGVSGEVGS